MTGQLKALLSLLAGIFTSAVRSFPIGNRCWTSCSSGFGGWLLEITEHNRYNGDRINRRKESHIDQLTVIIFGIDVSQRMGWH